MSQDVSNQQSARKQLISSNSTPVQPWSLESEADKLMDDLFYDLEQLLDRGYPLPKESVETDYSAVESESMIASETVAVSPQSEAESVDDITQPPEAQDKLELATPATITSSQDREPPKRYWDKIIFVLALGSLSAVIFWLVKQDKLKLPQFNFQGLNLNFVTTDSVTSQEDAQFIEYMQRSLKVLEQSSIATQQQPTQREVEPSTISVLPIPVSPSSPANQAPQTVIQPVYIPFYPPKELPDNSAATPVLPPPPTATATPAEPTAPPTPQAIVPPPAPPAPEVPAKPAPAATEIPTPPETPTATAPPPTPTPTPSNLNHTLTGLLESSDSSNSSALFDINGSSQRISIGESIGSSGWTLVAVENQQVVIRRNGEVRSIYPGQKF